MRQTRRAAMLVSAALAALAVAGQAQAQSAGSNSSTPPRAQSSAPDTISELVVTANKRPERILDVAMSDSAVSEPRLLETQSFDLQDIATQVAGLELEQGANQGFGTRIILRGLNTGGAGAEVATVVDDIPLSFSSAASEGGLFASDFEPWDMNRVEVLRGPQGTLYGAAAEGGLIKYVTNAPDPSGYHAGFEGGVLGVDHGGWGGDGKAYANLPLGDKAALRVSGYYEDLPGWIDNQLGGAKDINEERRFGGRAELLWRPITDLTVRLTAIVQEHNSGVNEVETNPAGSSDPYGLAHGYDFNTYLPDRAFVRSMLYAGNIEYDLHAVRLQSITSYGRIDQHFLSDSPYYGNLFAPGTTLVDDNFINLKKYSEEFRVVSEPGNQLFGHGFDWQTGLFVTREDAAFVENFNLTDYPSNTLNPQGSLLYANLPSYYEEAAIYADGTLKLSRSVDIEAGGRVFRNWQRTDQTEGGYFLGGPNTTSPATTSRETSGTFSVAPRWHITPDDMLYVRIASGYRPGGPEPFVLNAGATLPKSFTSDSTVNYEGGFKGDLFDHRLSLELTGFYVEWSRVQVNELVLIDNGASGATVTVNAGKAHTDGVEWDIAWKALPGLTLGTTGAYTDTSITSGVPQIPGTAGAELPYVPKWSGNLTAEYHHAVLQDVDGFVGGTLYYKGKRYSDFTVPRAGLPAGHDLLPSYTTLELHVGLTKGPYTIEVYGKNLTDARGITYYAPYGADTTLFVNGEESLIRPRTVGLRLAAGF